MQKCKIKSVRPLGRQKTYNVTMKSEQHNYAIYDKKTKQRIITSNSHSASYAFLAYQTVFLKLYFPIEFMCNLLSSEVNDEEKMALYLRAAERMKIICMPSDINKSGFEFKIEKGFHKGMKKDVEFLRKPLTMLKGVGTKAVRSIVDNQPFRSLEEFVKKIDARVVNVKVFATLVNSDCMDGWNRSKEELLEEYPKMKDKITKEKKAKKKQLDKINSVGPGSLFGEAFDYSGNNLEL